ncbi:MAG: endolytic transglycosylase MltG [Bacteroidota bacterium]
MTYYHTKYGSQKKRKRPRWVRFILFFLLLMIIASLIGAYLLYRVVYKSNVWTQGEASTSIYIPTDANFDDVKTLLYSQGLIIHRASFEWLATKKKYPELIKPGHYIVMDGMNNDALINMLRLGEQTAVDVTFNNIRTKEQLAQRVAAQIEADSGSLMALMNDSVYFARAGLTSETALTLMIPNTYEFFWNTSAKQFMDRMHREYTLFWDDKRDASLERSGLSRSEVVILASIVEKETNKNDEKANIAGVYINRLKRDWLLQADPTLVYASGDFGLRRVLNIHKEIDSPYNTYKYSGLPPGPICIPSIASIDAVVNFEDHNYFFFCAKDDLSGYHAFARTITQHNRNARKYRRAIENRK